jgi:hypothetical protein
MLKQRLMENNQGLKESLKIFHDDELDLIRIP